MELERSHNNTENKIIDVTRFDTEESHHFEQIKDALYSTLNQMDKQKKQVQSFLECLLKDVQKISESATHPPATLTNEFSISRYFGMINIDEKDKSTDNIKLTNDQTAPFSKILEFYGEKFSSELSNIREALIQAQTTKIHDEAHEDKKQATVIKNSFDDKQNSIRYDEEAINEQLNKTRTNIKSSLGNQGDYFKPFSNSVEEYINQSKQSVKNRIIDLEPSLKKTEVEILRQEIESLKQFIRNNDAHLIPEDILNKNENEDFQTSSFMKDLMKRIQFQKEDLGNKHDPANFNRILSRKLMRLFNGYEYGENLYSCKSILKVFYLSITDFVTVFLDFIQLISLFVNKIAQPELRQIVKNKILDFCADQVQKHSTFAQSIEAKQNEFFTDIKEVKELANDYNFTFNEFTKNNEALVKAIKDIITEDSNSTSVDVHIQQETSNKLSNV